MKNQLIPKIAEAKAHLQKHASSKTTEAELLLILGTGLGNIAEEVDEVIYRSAYSDIPHFASSTVVGHTGELLCVRIAQSVFWMMSGRLHYYEGYEMDTIVFPVRVLASLGIKKMIITNVSGGINPHFRAGDLVLFSDHINMMSSNPLRGMNVDELGPRFPDFLEVYDKAWRAQVVLCAKDLEIPIMEGVYYALPGPNLETPAEIRMIHRMGGDMVGMSTVPEVIAAAHAGMRILAVSLISNQCYPPEKQVETTVEQVLAVADKSSTKLARLIREIIIHERDL